jgi:hypothetical protein
MHYASGMITRPAATLPPYEPDPVRLRRLEAEHLQAMEGNPFTDEDRALFDMFEREGWTPDQQREYILARFRGDSATDAAE